MKFEANLDLLSTRTDGEKYRNILLQEYHAQGCCEVNFEGINNITPSFADELFAKMSQQMGADQFMRGVKIRNANNEVKSTILFAISNRKKMDERDECTKSTSEPF